MKDTATTITLVGLAAILGAIAYPSSPTLAITAWTISGLALLTLATAHIIRRKSKP